MANFSAYECCVGVGVVGWSLGRCVVALLLLFEWGCKVWLAAVGCGHTGLQKMHRFPSEQDYLGIQSAVPSFFFLFCCVCGAVGSVGSVLVRVYMFSSKQECTLCQLAEGVLETMDNDLAIVITSSQDSCEDYHCFMQVNEIF